MPGVGFLVFPQYGQLTSYDNQHTSECCMEGKIAYLENSVLFSFCPNPISVLSTGPGR